MRELVNNHERMFILEEDTRGALYFRVLCGGIGMYEVCIKLSDDECDGYANGGEEFLCELASEINYNSRAFSARSVSRQEYERLDAPWGLWLAVRQKIRDWVSIFHSARL